MFGWLLKFVALKLLARPLLRFCVGLAAVPAFRFVRQRCFRLHEINPQLEKDLELWFRGSLVLLVATANMEHYLFGWIPLDLQGDYAWLAVGMRILLAVSVVELMPDQDVFGLLHAGPPPIDQWFNKGLRHFFRQGKEILRGLGCQHLRRSSPVLAIMAAIFGGPPGAEAYVIGWVCYGVAVVQFLIIGLMTNRDRALNMLPEVEKRLAEARRTALEQLELEPGDFRPAPACEVGKARVPGADEPGEALPRRG